MLTIHSQTVQGRTVIRKYSEFNPFIREHCEKVFGVNLDGRGWTISADCMGFKISFFDKDEEVVFGWIQRKSLKEFFDSLEANDLYLKLK